MRIKRFEAMDTKSALAMVKEEMGENAVILTTKTLSVPSRKNGMQVEVVAAMDYDLEALTTLPQTARSDSATYGRQPIRRTNFNNFVTPASTSSTIDNDRACELSFNNHLLGGQRNETVNSEAMNLRRRFANQLGREEPQKPGASIISERKSRQLPPKPNPEEVRRWRDQLIANLKVKPIAAKTKYGPSVIAMVGATGVGKTTTAAKLAAWFTLREGRRVTLLTMDCYRIGATDQLRTYARIMRIPCEIVLKKDDLPKAIARHRNCDVIIIDTAGKSPYDREHINELNGWFATCEAIEPYLLISAISKKEDISNLVRSYEPLAPAGLILTKLDETRTYATLCQQVVASELPVSCLCTGQRVPEDFLPASKKVLETLFCQGWTAAFSGLDVFAMQQR